MPSVWPGDAAAVGSAAREAARTGRGVRVAIVDSGVHHRHPHVGGVAGGVGIDAAGRLDRDFVDRLGHGTAVAAAIREKAPEADLYAVRIFDTALTTSIQALVAAIAWAVRSQMHVVNLSLGTATAAHEAALRGAVDAAVAAGVLIVAARDDGGTRWLPGSLSGVVAVRADAAIARDTFTIEGERDALVFRASPYPRPIPGVPPERNLNGISFAVANMTGFLARALEPNARCTLSGAVRALAAARG